MYIHIYIDDDMRKRAHSLSGSSSAICSHEVREVAQCRSNLCSHQLKRTPCLGAVAPSVHTKREDAQCEKK